MKGTRVTCEDLETGEKETQVIEDNWLVIVDGVYELTYVQVSPTTGTAVITVKRARPE